MLPIAVHKYSIAYRLNIVYAYAINDRTSFFSIWIKVLKHVKVLKINVNSIEWDCEIDLNISGPSIKIRREKIMIQW